MKRFILLTIFIIALPTVFANQMNSSPTQYGAPINDIQAEEDSSFDEESIEDDEYQLEEERELAPSSDDEGGYETDAFGDDEEIEN